MEAVGLVVAQSIHILFFSPPLLLRANLEAVKALDLLLLPQ